MSMDLREAEALGDELIRTRFQVRNCSAPLSLAGVVHHTAARVLLEWHHLVASGPV